MVSRVHEELHLVGHTKPSAVVMDTSQLDPDSLVVCVHGEETALDGGGLVEPELVNHAVRWLGAVSRRGFLSAPCGGNQHNKKYPTDAEPSSHADDYIRKRGRESLFQLTPLARAPFPNPRVQWLEAMTRYRGTVSGGPGFAYDLCVSRIPPEAREELDLSPWRWAYCGGEPVRHTTLKRFSEAFAPYGFDYNTFHPCYGLVEHTSHVSGCRPSSEPPPTCAVRKEELCHGRVVRAEGTSTQDGIVEFVACGQSYEGHRVLIVDPERRVLMSDGLIGEIWLQGPSKARGYWNRPDETRDAFEAYLATGVGPFVRTGDLGFVEKEYVFVTGRRDELVLLDGRQYFPHDLEETVQESHEALRRHAGAVFTIPSRQGEQLVTIQEPERRNISDYSTVVESICQSVRMQHGLRVHAIVIVKPSTIPRITSGKIQRLLCREQFLAGKVPHALFSWTRTRGRESLR